MKELEKKTYALMNKFDNLSEKNKEKLYDLKIDSYTLEEDILHIKRNVKELESNITKLEKAIDKINVDNVIDKILK